VESAKKLYNLVNNEDLIFEIEYESIYGERWKLSSESLIPLKLK